MDDLIYDKVALKLFDDAKMRKHYYLILCHYDIVFKEDLLEISSLEGSVETLNNIIKRIEENNNLSLDEIDKIIEEEKSNYKKNMTKYLNKLRNSNDVYKASLNMSDEFKKKFDEEFYEFIYNYNPFLVARPTKEHIILASTLDQFFLDGKYAMFKMYYSILKQKINVNDKNDESLYKKLDGLFKSFDEFTRFNKIINLGKAIEERNVFESDLSILAEKSEYRVKKNRLLAASKQLHTKFIKIYGEDIDLSFKV